MTKYYWKTLDGKYLNVCITSDTHDAVPGFDSPSKAYSWLQMRTATRGIVDLGPIDLELVAVETVEIERVVS